MGKITLIANDATSRASYLDSCSLPHNYMEDYTVAGLLVSHYRRSIELLQSAGFPLTPKAFATEITIESPAEIRDIRVLLAKEAIISEFSDIADSIYQA